MAPGDARVKGALSPTAHFTPTLSLSLSLLSLLYTASPGPPFHPKDATQNYHLPQRTDKSHSRGEDNFGVCIFSQPTPPTLDANRPCRAELTWGVRYVTYTYVYSILLRAHELQVENAIPGVSPRGLGPLHAPCSRVHAWCALTHQAQNSKTKTLSLL